VGAPLAALATADAPVPLVPCSAMTVTAWSYPRIAGVDFTLALVNTDGAVAS
jgi:hypothetical protein